MMHRVDTAPRVSVVMAVHNGAPYLREAVESILAQTFTEFEFIIIDDGSTDATASILAEYGDPRLRLVRNAANIGLTRSLNKGLTLAQGKYIARMDADDVSLPERLAIQVAHLDAHPDVGLLGTGYYLINEDGERFTDTAPAQPLTHTEIRWQLLFHNAFCHSSVMFWRPDSVLGMYDEQIVYAQDYALFARLASLMQMTNLPDLLLAHRVHHTQIGQRRRLEQLQSADRTSQQALVTIGVALDLAAVARLRQHYGCLTDLPVAEQQLLAGQFIRILERFAEQPDLAEASVRRIWWGYAEILVMNARRNNLFAAPAAAAFLRTLRHHPIMAAGLVRQRLQHSLAQRRLLSPDKRGYFAR